MFAQIMLSPQVKRNAIISNAHGIYQLKKRLQDPRKLGNIRQISKLHRIIAQRPASLQKEHFANTSKKLLKIGIGPLRQRISHETQSLSQISRPRLYLSPLSFILTSSNKPWIALNLLLALYKTVQKLSHHLWQPAFVRVLPSFYRSFSEVYRLHWLETINKKQFILQCFLVLLPKWCPNSKFFLARIFPFLDYSVKLRIQSKRGKIGTRKNSKYRHFEYQKTRIVKSIELNPFVSNAPFL